MLVYGIKADNNNVARIDSREIAEAYEKDHEEVLRDIVTLRTELGCDLESRTANGYLEQHDTDSNGQETHYFLLDRDAFVFLTFMYNNSEEDKLTRKEIVEEFIEVEAAIEKSQTLWDMHPMLAEAIENTREDAKPKDFIKESDIIFTIVLGTTAKKYRTMNNIPNTEGIRQHISTEENELLDWLQTVDIGVQYTTPEYQLRKQLMELCAYRWREEKSLPSAESEGDAA